MPYKFPPEVERLVRDRMASGNYATEDELLREALEALAEEEEDVRAIREAIAEMDAGDAGIPLDAAFDELRSQQRAAVRRLGPAHEDTLE